VKGGGEIKTGIPGTSTKKEGRPEKNPPKPREKTKGGEEICRRKGRNN